MKKHEFLVRASRLGDLMSNDRSGKGMGETAKKYILETAIFNKYGIEPKEISNKYLEKGILNEKEGIILASKVLGWLDVNPDAPKIRLVNDYLVGEPDVDTKFLLADIKNSYDVSTFPLLSEKIPNKGYEYQLQGYIMLTGKDEAELVYTLTDCPEYQIYDEVNRLVWKNTANPKYAHLTQNELEELIEANVRKSLVFSDKIPAEKRVKRFIVKKDLEVQNKIIARIDEARLEYDRLIEII
jgi:hypothetical protein